jgi:pyruvate kinase
MRKTKIICTIGPASDSEEMLRAMMLAGMDVARLNFSHGTYDDHQLKIDRIKKLRVELGLHTALLLDTKGPEIRLGEIKNGLVTLSEGQTFTIYADSREGDATGASVTYPDLYRDVKPGGTILIDDGLIELGIEAIRGKDIICTVLNGGLVSTRKGVNVPGAFLSIPFMSDRDRADLAFGVKNDFDFVAASFTQNADNIRRIRHELEKLGCTDMRIIAKIENSAGVENCDEILNEADGIMVARGDMGVEMPMERIPGIQKKLIERCYLAGKPVITATQMLESMTKNPRPTRAEITDVANAIYDGTSAIMLSGETANGLYPLEAVKTMAKIAEHTESEIDYLKRFAALSPKGFSSVTGAISHATCTTAHDLHAAAIITVTKSGHTARMLSSYRPDTPIIGCSPEPKTCRHMNMSWGVMPLLIEEKYNTDDLVGHAVDMAYSHNLVEYGDLVVITTGLPLGISGTTNMLKVQIVGNVLISGTGIGKESICGTLCVCTGENTAPQDFADGDIIVVPSASEKIIHILRRARGIICERGGVDSYAAIVGQALGIPVIVGAHGATKILRSGTVVTLDAARGIVVVSDKC